jgi:hypothetical protein
LGPNEVLYPDVEQVMDSNYFDEEEVYPWNFYPIEPRCYDTITLETHIRSLEPSSSKPNVSIISNDDMKCLQANDVHRHNWAFAKEVK